MAKILSFRRDNEFNRWIIEFKKSDNVHRNKGGSILKKPTGFIHSTSQNEDSFNIRIFCNLLLMDFFEIENRPYYSIPDTFGK